jgi:hypothetical protein
MDNANYHRVTAENIALLRLLSSVPEPLTQNALSVAFLDIDTERLPFQKECDIVETLAFVSGISDDPEKVTAVCIQEDIDHQGLTVVLAVNKGDFEVGREGFKRISRILEKISLQGKHKD